jgi:Fic family protein
VSAYGAWQDWLIYFLNGVAVQSADALSRAERINNLITEWKNKVGGSSSHVLVGIVQQLAINPFLTIKKTAEHFRIAFTTAQRAVAKLESLGIITQTTKSKRDRTYCSIKILDILEEPTKINEDLVSVLKNAST